MMKFDSDKSYSFADKPAFSAFPIARPGYPYIFAAAFVTAVFALLGLIFPALLCLGLTIFICAFFRDPDRLVPQDENTLVAPADGRIVYAGMEEKGPFVDGPCLKISIFMSVFNVHINRAPVACKVNKVAYYPGRFLNASLDKASIYNERNALFLEDEKGRQIVCVQVAGLVARRILCAVGPSDSIERGARFGMIAFGSRVDLYLPQDAKPLVRVGDRVWGGSSIIGTMP
jgi:phosphatidylserine decarboxylase